MCKSSKTIYNRQSSDNRLKKMDFSELEARTFAHMKDADRMGDSEPFKRSDDPITKNILLKGVVKGVDMHIKQAAELFDVPVAEVSKEMRAFAKSFTFRKLYGGDCAEVNAFVQAAVVAAKTRLNK